MSHAKKIAENAAWLMVATAGQKAVTFVAFTAVARLVGAQITGEYFFAVSITSIFVTLGDLGLTPVVIRELAADEARGRATFARALRIKALLVPFATFGAIFYAWITQVDAATLFAVGLAAVFVMATDSTSLIWYAALRGRRELRFEAMGMFVGQCLTAVFGITAAYLGWGVIGLICALAVGSLWNVGWSIRKVYGLKIGPVARNMPRFRDLMQLAIPFALAGIFVKIYSYVDSLMLRHWHGSVAVGQYAVAYKLTYALQFLPLTFVAALYPGMSNAAANDKKALKPLLEGSLRLMLLASVPLATLLSVLAPRLIPLLYGEDFSGAILPLQILPWVLIPIFLDFPIGSLLNATRRAGKKTTAMGITMVVNVIANFWLVPTYGPTGAAIAGVISFWVLFLVGWGFVRKEVGNGWLAWLLVRGLGAAAITWCLVTWLTVPMLTAFAILFAVALMMVCAFVFQLLTLSDVVMVWRWLQSRVAPAPTEDESLHDKP